MSYFSNQIKAIRLNVQASRNASIAARAARKGLEVKASKVIFVTYNENWTSR